LGVGLVSTVAAVAGLIAAASTTGCWLPQVFRTFRTRRVLDFSWGYLGLCGWGVACWLLYGLMRGDPALVGANLVTLVLVLGVVAVKWRTELGAQGNF
jgi:MtN3 and saliva related transmembrane protein